MKFMPKPAPLEHWEESSRGREAVDSCCFIARDRRRSACAKLLAPCSPWNFALIGEGHASRSLNEGRRICSWVADMGVSLVRALPAGATLPLTSIFNGACMFLESLALL
jgi:hypothetical protein